MLRLFGFDRIGVAISDLYFVDPDPTPGQEGAERGARLEVRFVERGELNGTIYSAQPIAVGRAIWRADLLESVAGPPASYDRTHHHPRFSRKTWDPGARTFEPELSAHPLKWVGHHLADLPGILRDGGVDPDEVGPNDAEDLRAAVPEIMAALRSTLEAVHGGSFADVAEDQLISARIGWL